MQRNGKVENPSLCLWDKASVCIILAPWVLDQSIIVSEGQGKHRHTDICGHCFRGQEETKIPYVYLTLTLRLPYVYLTCTAVCTNIQPYVCLTCTLRLPYVYLTPTLRLPYAYLTLTLRLPYAYPTPTLRLPYVCLRFTLRLPYTLPTSTPLIYSKYQIKRGGESEGRARKVFVISHRTFFQLCKVIYETFHAFVGACRVQTFFCFRARMAKKGHQWKAVLPCGLKKSRVGLWDPGSSAL